ncbi:MAG: hypothetical protein NC251_09340 [Lachnoclostridium sp.]|nr:hypothetical protein [Lachnospira sp.]MCM1248621.1 hypothetical protein [Lachnoclostridium sp.]MCM1536504.1 hypothetical protein [Clostridium sp.]
MKSVEGGEYNNEYDFFNFRFGRGILCAIGDILFDLRGRGNKKLGTSKNIDSNWMHMAYWRFGASISVAFVGDVLLGFGFLPLVNQIQPVNTKLAAVVAVCGYGFMLVATVCVAAAILMGYLAVPKWFVLLNPFVFLFIGVGLRKLNSDRFCDLPGIIMPSLGMGMFGVIGIVSLL